MISEAQFGNELSSRLGIGSHLPPTLWKPVSPYRLRLSFYTNILPHLFSKVKHFFVVIFAKIVVFSQGVLRTLNKYHLFSTFSLDKTAAK